MDLKQDNLETALPEAVMPDINIPKSIETLSTAKQDMNYDFNFENKTIDAIPKVAESAQQVTITPIASTVDHVIEQVNPNPVIPINIVPVDIGTAAGAVNIKPIIKSVEVPIAQSNIKTSGTATEDEIIIDASKGTVEVLDEYVIKMDAAAEKAKNNKNNVFIGVVFGVIILFIILLKVIINIVGY